jgi:hypothetical protein
VGYRYPHDYEGADVEQRYLPEELGERRYYMPTDQGYEQTIGTRMVARLEAREAARTKGGPRRSRLPKPEVDGMRAGDKILRTREESRRRLAETEQRDASG